VVDAGAIEPVVARLVAENPQQVENAKKNPKVVGWFVGQVMKATGGKANPGLVNELVRKALGLE
jgi:aspartyl-tRNA(Asn)/glutamyl-tRNA(Gln) amidotransferase subunit B